MDIIKPASDASAKRRPIILVFVVIALLSFSVWSFRQPSAQQKVLRSQIWTDVARQGDLMLSVAGYGKLKSKQQRVLTAAANATVEQIVLKPGALVKVDSVIIRLANPEIDQQVKQARRELSHLNTNYQQLVLQQKREILAQKAAQEQLLSQLEAAQLKMAAEQKLVAEGIVSELTFKQSQLEHRQLSRRIAIERTRLEQLLEVQQKELAIEQDKITQQQEQVAVIEQRFDKLTVKAGINGVLQSLPVELGQSVAAGEQVALVGSVDSLYAMLNISQSEMDLVKLEQSVVIDTRGGTVDGYISRINPVVNQGMIAVEVALTGALPSNARPELNVDGTIAIGTLNNVTYIKKPVNAQAGMKGSLFKLAGQNQAQQINVTYGQASGEYIQLLRGATANDSFILSDMSRWQDEQQISITD